MLETLNMSMENTHAIISNCMQSRSTEDLHVLLTSKGCYSSPNLTFSVKVMTVFFSVLTAVQLLLAACLLQLLDYRI